MALDARLVSARPLDRETIQKVEKKFSDIYKQPVRISAMVDDQILGGMIVEIDGKVWDGSLRKKLASSVEHLTYEGFAGTMDEMVDVIGDHVDSFVPEAQPHPVGKVISMGDGVVRVDRMAGCRSGELCSFGGDVFGIALNLEQDCIMVALLGNDEKVTEGMPVEGTGRVVEVPVGDQLLGRVVDSLGRAIDGGPPILTRRRRPVEAEAPSVLDRQAINEPLETGILAIDSMIPIGKGQRELIIGDRQTGKSSIAIDTILNQRGKNVLCVYVAIGQKASTVAGVHKTLTDGNAMGYTCIVCATASDPAPMQYLAPYSGCAIAEDFMYSGRDVLIVYDDLSKHAVAYRALSLLLKRPSGREAFPGDVFYLHSRLLERAAKLNDDWGGGSMTALPVIETMSGDISAYIPTNVISITDGQVFLESELFHSGVRPAINVGLSVSRVGGSAQTRAMRKVSGRLRLDLAQFRELSIFAQFGSDLEKSTQELLAQGERVTWALKQPLNQPLPLPEQVVLLYAVTRGLVKQLTPEQVMTFKRDFLPQLRIRYSGIVESITTLRDLTPETEEEIKRAVSEYLAAVKA